MKSNIWGVIGRLVFAAMVYFISQERNNCIFKKGLTSIHQLYEVIFGMVRLKIMSLWFCKSSESKLMFSLWKIVDHSLVE